jgi:hypothetical protein
MNLWGVIGKSATYIWYLKDHAEGLIKYSEIMHGNISKNYIMLLK